MFTVQSISSYLDDHAQEAANLFKSIVFRTLWILWCSRASPLPIAAANKSNR